MKGKSIGMLNKFLCPRLPATVLHRERLVKILADAAIDQVSTDTTSVSHYKLILLHAPAGYGKTTVIADFARHTDLTCCWYLLDNSDGDIVVFLQNLIISLRSQFPQFGPALDSLVANAISTDIHNHEREHNFEILINSFLLSIEREIAQKFVLILCNYHIVNDRQEIKNTVNRLIHFLPDQCVIIIESRALPNLDFNSFLLHQELLVLGINKLGFTAQEVCDLARLQGIAQLELEEAEQLALDFEGWITGILLGTHLGDIQFLASNKDADRNWKFPIQPMNRKNLLSYILKEVFSLEPDIHLFLKEVSILPQINPNFCNALLDIQDADDRLIHIEQQGLFITRGSDDSGLTYICHPVLRELFYEELRLHNPQRFIKLHCRAARILLEQKEYTQAIFHALEAQEYDLAAHIISKISKNMLVQGYSETIAAWIDEIPNPTLELYPQLLLSRANVYLTQYKTDEALTLLEKALDATARLQMEEDTKKILSAEILIAQSFAFFHIGEYSFAQKLSSQAIDLLPAEERTLLALAYQRMGLCTSILGDCTKGITQLQQALQLWGHHTINRQAAFLYGQLAKTYNMIGNYALAEHHRIRAIHCWEQLGDISGKINNLIGMGVTHLHRGVYDEAEAVLQQALALSRAQKFSRAEAYALINLGEVYQEQKLYQKALVVAEDGLAQARQYQDSYLTNYALCTLAMIYLLMGDSQTSLLLLSEVTLKTSEIMSYEGCFHELIRGTVLLDQQRYDEAYTCLSSLENIALQAGWRRRLLQITIRLAACQLGRKQNTLAIQNVEKAALLTKQGGYEHLLQLELQRQPALSQVVQMIPEQTVPERKTEILPQYDQRTWNIQVRQPSLRTHALGVPTVLLDDKPIKNWRMTRTIELYFFLLNSDYPMHKEQIIVALWPDADERIDQTFRSTVHYLRKTIGNVCVVQHAGTYELNLDLLYAGHSWYDVTSFESLYAQAKSALAAENDAVAKEAFQKMLALYHGDYLLSFYNDWCRLRRDDLRRTYMDAITQLARIMWRTEIIDECLHYWQELLKLDSYREDAFYGVMCCYIRLGKRTQAIKQYQQFEEILREELSATPGLAIQKLYQKLTLNNG
jgi:LuxR family transcriptional regulator, maltose regulon positive regulatory protein